MQIAPEPKPWRDKFSLLKTTIASLREPLAEPRPVWAPPQERAQPDEPPWELPEQPPVWRLWWQAPGPA